VLAAENLSECRGKLGTDPIAQRIKKLGVDRLQIVVIPGDYLAVRQSGGARLILVADGVG
jgi:hypothetical protein